jgi:cytochrome c peroxidase
MVVATSTQWIPVAITPDGLLQNANADADNGPPGASKSDTDHLRDMFHLMEFTDQEIVALGGAIALGRCHTTASEFDGSWMPTPPTFHKAYFTLLQSLD